MSLPNYTLALVATPVGATTALKGYAAVYDDSTGTYLVATTANLGSKKPSGLFTANCPLGGSVVMLTIGDASTDVTSLASGTSSALRVSTTGALERVASPTPTDNVVGWVETNGFAHLNFGVWALSANGGGTVTSVSGTAPIAVTAGNTPVVSISAASAIAAGSMSAADYSKLLGLPTSAVPTTTQVIAGAGQTGGGALSGNVTLNIIANADGSIVVNADDIQVGVINVTQHGTLAGGTTHANAVAAGAAGFMSGTDKTKLDGITSGAAVASVSGSAPIVSSGGTTPVISITAATTLAAGSLSSSDKTKLDSLTSGAAVASVSGSAPVVSSGGTTPAISVTGGTPVTQTPDQSNAAGAATALAYAAHVHNIPAAIVNAITPDQTTAKGSAASFALSDHTHNVATAAASTLTPDLANATGAASTFARSNHIHNVPTAAAANQTPDQTSAQGSAASFARSDHVHNIPAAIVGGITPDQTTAKGTAASFALSDHAHNVATAAAVSQTPDQANATGTGNNFARATHVHNIATAAPVTIGTANSQGAAATFANSAHVHNHGDQTTGTHHAAATTSTNGFMSATDKTRFNKTGVWTTVCDVDFSAQSTQSLSTDTTYSIGGYTFTKVNSAQDNTAMAVTNLSGLVMIPKAGGKLWQAGVQTSPMLYITMANLESDPSAVVMWRTRAYISAENSAATGDVTLCGAYWSVAVGAPTAANTETAHVVRGWQTAGGTHKVGSQLSTQATPVTSNTLAVGAGNNVIACQGFAWDIHPVRGMFGQYAAGWPAESAYKMAAWISANTDTNITCGIGPLNMGFYVGCFRNNSATALSVTCARFSVEFMYG